jgi:hypothetical protein
MAEGTPTSHAPGIRSVTLGSFPCRRPYTMHYLYDRDFGARQNAARLAFPCGAAAIVLAAAE